MLRRSSGEFNGLFVALVAALAGIAVGSIAPWVTVTGLINHSRGGLDAGDGWISLGAAALCAPILWVQSRHDSVRRPIAVSVLSAIAAAVAINDIADIKGVVDASEVKVASVDAGWGVYFVAGCSLLGVVLAIGIALDAIQATLRRRRDDRARKEHGACRPSSYYSLQSLKTTTCRTGTRSVSCFRFCVRSRSPASRAREPFSGEPGARA